MEKKYAIRILGVSFNNGKIKRQKRERKTSINISWGKGCRRDYYLCGECKVNLTETWGTRGKDRGPLNQSAFLNWKHKL